MEKRKNTIETISRAVKSYFAQNGISISEAASRLGKSPQNLASSLAKGIGKNFASSMSEEFGFSQTFLITGEGSLLPDVSPKVQPEDMDELHRLRIQVDDLMTVTKRQNEIIYNLTIQKGDMPRMITASYIADREPRNR